MTQSSELFALVKYLRENDHKVVKIKLLADYKKFLPKWLKCNTKDEYDKYFNPIIVNEEDGRKRQADLIEISDTSYMLRSKAGELNITSKGFEEANEDIWKSKTLTRSAVRSKDSIKRKREESNIDISKDDTIGSITPHATDERPITHSTARSISNHVNYTASCNDNESCKYQLRKKKRQMSDAEDSGIKRSFSTSTPVKSPQKLPSINTSIESISMFENKLDHGKMEIISMNELNQAVIDNLTKIYNEIARLEEQIKDLSPPQSNEDISRKVLVGGKYPIEKASVSYGLAKNTIEKYFRELIAHGWKHEEKAHHNLTGSGARGNKKINIEKMNAFINYCLNSWNEFHTKNNPGINNNNIVLHHLIDEKRRTLKSLMGLICQEETKKAKKMKN